MEATTPATGTTGRTSTARPVALDADRTTGVVETGVTFSELYRGEYEALVRVAFLIIGSREQAEEAVQEAFVRLHGRWSSVANPRSYLRSAVVNGCRDTIRRRVRWRRREPVLGGPVATTDDPDELFDALARLSPRQRAVVVLRFYEGLQEAEIAAATGMKVGTVKSTLHRSIERLRKEIEP